MFGASVVGPSNTKRLNMFDEVGKSLNRYLTRLYFKIGAIGLAVLVVIFLGIVLILL